MKKCIYILIVLSIFSLLFGCNNFENTFNKLVSIKEKDFLQSVNLGGSATNKDYFELYNMGKKINTLLLEKAVSIKETNLYKSSMNVELTEGDIAICLLLDINKINDDEFYDLIPSPLVNDYEGSGARVWWDWIQADIENRKWVIEKIKLLVSAIK